MSSAVPPMCFLLLREPRRCCEQVIVSNLIQQLGAPRADQRLRVHIGEKN